MTKKKAIEKMKKGAKITHWLFSSNEFIYMQNGVLLDENDYVMNWFEFWKYRTNPNFEHGWEIKND